MGALNLLIITLSCVWCTVKGRVDGWPSDQSCDLYCLRVVGISLLLGMLVAIWMGGGMRGVKDEVVAVKEGLFSLFGVC